MAGGRKADRGDPEELRGSFESPRAVKFHKDNFLIARLTLRDGNVTSVKGTMVTPRFGVEYAFKGWWEEGRGNYGPTFAFDSYETFAPRDVTGILTYIQQTARWIGPVIAGRIVDRYGEQTLEVLKTNPERVAAEIGGVTSARAREIADALIANEEVEKLEVDLRALLGPAGVNQRQFRRILDHYGHLAPEIIRKDPYQLIEKIAGVGWETADAIGKVIGLKPEQPERIRAGILHILKENENTKGDLCAERKVLCAHVATLLQVPFSFVDNKVYEMTEDEELYDHKGDIYREAMWHYEKSIAETVTAMLIDEDLDELAAKERRRRELDEAFMDVPRFKECEWEGCSAPAEGDFCRDHAGEALARLFPNHPLQGIPFPMKERGGIRPASGMAPATLTDPVLDGEKRVIYDEEQDEDLDAELEEEREAERRAIQVSDDDIPF